MLFPQCAKYHTTSAINIYCRWYNYDFYLRELSSYYLFLDEGTICHSIYSVDIILSHPFLAPRAPQSSYASLTLLAFPACPHSLYHWRYWQSDRPELATISDVWIDLISIPAYLSLGWLPPGFPAVSMTYEALAMQLTGFIPESFPHCTISS
jgi:hypothetical protein